MSDSTSIAISVFEAVSVLSSASAAHSDSSQEVWPSCGATIWVYPTATGSVALDDSFGPFVVDGGGHVFWLGGAAGYRAHGCEEAHLLPAVLDGVAEDEFLWPVKL